MPHPGRTLISERTVAGLARGRTGGRPYKMTRAKVRLAIAAMGHKETKVGALCEESGVTRQNPLALCFPAGELRPDGEKLLKARGLGPTSTSEPEDPTLHIGPAKPFRFTPGHRTDHWTGLPGQP